VVFGHLGILCHQQGAGIDGRLHSGSRRCGAAKINRSANGSKQRQSGEREQRGDTRFAVL